MEKSINTVNHICIYIYTYICIHSISLMTYLLVEITNSNEIATGCRRFISNSLQFQGISSKFIKSELKINIRHWLNPS